MSLQANATTFPAAWLNRRAGGGFERGSRGLSEAMRARAQKIIAAANGYTTRAVMATPPTVTYSADFAASTIGGGDAGAPTISPNDARIRKTAPLINQFSAWYGGWAQNDIRSDGGDGWGFGIKTNSANLEIALGFGQADYTICFRINGQWMSANDTALFGASPSFNPRFIKLAFGSQATRTIEFFLRHTQDIRGINIDAGATLALPDVTGNEVWGSIWGDSYVEANSGLNVRENVGHLFGEVMGMPDIIPHGRSNQGYVLARDAHTISSRMVNDSAYVTSPALDVVYAFGSVNDFNQSATTIQANVAAGVAALKARYPNAWIIFFSSFNTQNNHIDATRNAAFYTGALSVADSRVIVIDTQAASWPVTAATTGTLPNAAAHDSADGIHPGPNERAYLVGSLMKPAVIAALQAKIAAVGTLATTEAPDTFAANGQLGVIGALAATEARDVFAAAGTVANAASSAPSFTSSAAQTTPENAPFALTLTTDQDPNVSYAIVGGLDQAAFSVASSSMAAASAFDYEAPTDSNADNVYQVIVRATNFVTGLTTDQTVTVTVTNVVDETPVITSASSTSVAENATLAFALTAVQVVTWAITGGADAARFEISGSTLRWAGNGTKNYEAPNDANADNAYVVQVTASDSFGHSANQTITVTVTDVVEAAAWTPASLTVAPALWLDPSNSGSVTQSSGRISQINDLSGHSAHAVQATSGNQPLASAASIGGLTAAFFSSSRTDGLVAPLASAITGDHAVFMVDRPQMAGIGGGTHIALGVAGSFSWNNDLYWALHDWDPNSLQGVYIGRNGSNSGIPAYTDDTPFIAGATWASGVATPYVNGTADTALTKTGAFNITHVALGRDVWGAYDPVTAYLGETIVLGYLPTTLERQKIEGYLAWKWGTQAALPGGHPYKSAAP